MRAFLTWEAACPVPVVVQVTSPALDEQERGNPGLGKSSRELFAGFASPGEFSGLPAPFLAAHITLHWLGAGGTCGFRVVPRAWGHAEVTGEEAAWDGDPRSPLPRVSAAPIPPRGARAGMLSPQAAHRGGRGPPQTSHGAPAGTVTLTGPAGDAGAAAGGDVGCTLPTCPGLGHVSGPHGVVARPAALHQVDGVWVLPGAQEVLPGRDESLKASCSLARDTKTNEV